MAERLNEAEINEEEIDIERGGRETSLQNTIVPLRERENMSPGYIEEEIDIERGGRETSLQNTIVPLRERENMSPGYIEEEIDIERGGRETNGREINEIQRQLSHFQSLLNSETKINEQERESFMGLLHTNPELYKALDLHQQSLLHLASANGHIEIVKVLTAARPEMCQARDRDGANPLHVAAIRGKVHVLVELLEANPHAARDRVDNCERDTILHLCVKYYQPECLENLLEKCFRRDEFVNAKDNTDNTILHIALVARTDRRMKIVQQVLSCTGIDVNAVNASKQTAMDILLAGKEKGTRLEGLERDIQWLLENCNAKTAREADILDPTEIAEKRSGIIVATVLMATLAFQTGVAPPGGVSNSGKAVMASNHPILYSFFLCYNILGFISSLGTLVLMMTDLPFKPGRYTRLTFITMSTTITSIAITYSISLVVVSPPLKREPITKIVLAPAASVILLLLLIAIIAGMIKRTNWTLVMKNRRRLARFGQFY